MAADQSLKTTRPDVVVVGGGGHVGLPLSLMFAKAGPWIRSSMEAGTLA